MNRELKILNIEIDKVRSTLYKLTSSRSLTDTVVVLYSQKLDRLLNRYNQLLS
jgi:hypothetical protein